MAPVPIPTISHWSGGRHGNVINPIGVNGVLDKNDLATDIKDAAHISLDQRKAEPYKKRVEIIDIAKHSNYQTSVGLKALCKAKAKENKKVILAWCYGIFTHCESTQVKHGEDVSNSKHTLYSQFDGLLKMSVKSIVDKYW